MTSNIKCKAIYLSSFLLQFLLIQIQQSESQITTSGLMPLDEPPTFVLFNLGYGLNEVSPQPPLTIESTIGDPAVPGLDFTGFEYEVTWFAEGEVTKQRVTRQLSSSGNDVTEKLVFSSTGNNGYRLGEKVYATFRVRYYRLDSLDSFIQEFSPWSELKESNIYKTGILITPDGDINLKECSENYTKITVTLKTPVNCPNNNNNGCVLGIQIFLERIPGTAFYWTSRQEVVLSVCHISLDNNYLNKPTDIFLKGVCDVVEESNDTVLLRMEYTQSTYFWNTFVISDKKIRIFDTPSKWCTYHGDPHMQTFDGFSYSYFGIGDFVLYKNEELKLEINARLWPCVSVASCICGIAIREGNDVLILKGCNIDKPWQFELTLKTVSPTSFSSIQVLKELSTGNKFHIFLRGGAQLIVKHTYNPDVEKSWVNTMIRVLDTGVHQGMCGNYDGIAENDLGYGGDAFEYTGDPDGFGESWRLVFNEDSWFNKTVKYSPSVQRQMCSCGMRAGWWSESEPKLATRCSFYEENYFLALQRDTKDITKSLQATGGRFRRANNDSILDVFDEDPNDEGEFDTADFKNYVEIKTFSWPTASGLTENDVYGYCRGMMFSSSGASRCQNVTMRREVGNYSSLLDTCVKDIQITDAKFWSSSAQSTFYLQCHQAILKEYAEHVANETDSIQSDGTQAVSDAVVLVSNAITPTCPADCSRNGTCANGACACNEGRTGKECSLRSDQAPVLKAIYGKGLCDVRVRVCRLSRVHGYAFTNSPGSRLSCHVESFEVFNFTSNLTQASTVTNAQLIDLYQVQCDLLPHDVSLDRNPYEMGTPAFGMKLAVSNNGKTFSNKQTLIIFDGLCLDCTDQEKCLLKNNTCLINGRCYAKGEKHAFDATKYCQPGLDSGKWTEITDTRSNKKGVGTTVIIIAGVIAPLVVLLGLAVALRFWIVGARRGGAEFDTNREDDFFFHY